MSSRQQPKDWLRCEKIGKGMQKMGKIIRILVVGIVSLAITALTTSSESVGMQTISVAANSVFGIAIASLYELIDTHDQGFKTWFNTQVLYRNKIIRLSFSYLFKIQVDGKYLLVRGHRMKNQFQPIGGVYKVYDEGKSFMDKIRAVSDTSMGNTDETDDLRLQIKGKEYFKFWEWFKSMEDREYDPRREFEEELLDTGILPVEAFQKLKYRKTYSHNVGVKYSQPLQTHEVVYADIFEIKLSDRQKQIIRDAVQQNPNQICLASADDIRCRRYGNTVQMNLGNNTPWLLGEE